MPEILIYKAYCKSLNIKPSNAISLKSFISFKKSLNNLMAYQK